LRAHGMQSEVRHESQRQAKDSAAARASGQRLSRAEAFVVYDSASARLSARTTQPLLTSSRASSQRLASAPR
jgi:hypothetical protein